MTFGEIGGHRPHRTGGTRIRRNGEIFANTFQGKLAEFAVCDQLRNCKGLIQPDTTVSPRGFWDEGDVTVDNCKIAVKSTKSFGNLLLLEKSDWTIEADYVNSQGLKSPDFHCLVRISPDVSSLMESKKLLYADAMEVDVLHNCLFSDGDYTYDCGGVATKGDLQTIIKYGHLLPKDSLLNEYTKIDADNYYFQAGDLRPIQTILDYLVDPTSV